MSAKVLILMGSDSDLPVMKSAADTLKEFGVRCEVRVLSVHRAPEKAFETARKAREHGFRVIICGAGLAAHLAGGIASQTTLPVIGVPLDSGPLHGLDSLLSTVQMPPGVPVATVAVGGARNAAVLAVQILATSDDRLAEQLTKFKERLQDQVLERDQKVREEHSR